jgi:hypothetical protein
MSPTQKNRLTRLVKRALDLMRLFVFAGAVVWPIVVLVVGLGIPPEAESRHTDISAYLNFRLNAVEAVDTASARVDQGQTLINGNGNLWLNNTKSSLAWWVSGAITYVQVLFALYGVILMRRLFTSLVDGKTFSDANAELIQKFGWLVLVFQIVAPALRYVGGLVILKDIAYDVPGIELFPSFQFSVGGLLTGLAILVLAGVLREASALHREQALTI